MDLATVLEFLRELAAHRVVHGMGVGWVSAALVDYQAFRNWQSFDDVYKYDWKRAIFRWVQGALLGGLAALGLSAATT